jgi:hypothetical protein
MSADQPVFARASQPPPRGEDEPDPWLIVAELLEALAGRVAKTEDEIAAIRSALASRQSVKSIVHERDPQTQQIVRSVITET